MVQPPVRLPLPSDSQELPTLSSAERRRSPWRRRLVEAERGLTEGFRSDSTLIVHFFVAIMVAAAAVVFGVSLIEWGLLAVSVTLVFTAELFHLALRFLVEQLESRGENALHIVRKLTTAGVFFAILGQSAIVLIVFTPRLFSLFFGSE